MSLHWTDAGQAEMLRATQKDQTYIERIQQYVSQTLIQLGGNRTWMKYSDIIKLVTTVGYYGLTTLSNLQTIGEEYTGIVQVDSAYISVPHKLTQLLNILLDCGGELFLKSCLKSLQQLINDNNELRPVAKMKLLQICLVLDSIVPFIQRLHKGLFFFNGGYFHISKRITGITHVLTRHWLKENQFKYGFKLLGVITLVHLCLYTGTDLIKAYNTDPITFIGSRKAKDSISDGSSSLKCVLCLEDRINASVTSCGHVFCWSCIVECTTNKPECPLCREVLKPSRTLLLQNYP